MSMNLCLSSSQNGTRNVNVTRDFVADFSGVGDDTTNNTTPLMAFNTFGVAQSLPVILTVPAGTYKISSNAAQFFGNGILNYEMRGVSAATSRFHMVSPASPLSVAGRGQYDDGTHNSRVLADLIAGDSFLMIEPSDASKFPIGTSMLVTSLALQGTVGSPFGFPTNAQFFDFATVTASNGGTGRIDFTPPLTDSHKTTYPLISAGNGSTQNAQGGPAWAYALHPSWPCNVTLRNIGFEYAENDITTYGGGALVNFYDCAWLPSIHGPCPSVAGSSSYVRCDCSDNVIEVDKFIGSLTYDQCSIQQLWFQSSSTKALTVRNCQTATSSTVAYLDGTPRTALIEDNDITQMAFGPTSYGCAESAVFNRNVVTTWGGATYTDPLIDANLQMSLGVIRTVARLAITSCADNGSGKVRLGVASTAELATGMTLNAQGAFVTGGQNTAYVLTVVDGTHVDLLTLNFASVTWTTAGYLANQAMRWAVPGRWITMRGSAGYYGVFQIIDVTEAADIWYVQTNLAGGWPTGITSISPHPCESFTGTGNTGCPEALEHSMAYAQGKPLYSYVNRTYDKTLTTTPAARPNVWGNLVATDAMSVNVTTAYTGVQGTLTWKPTQFATQVRVLRAGSIVPMDLTINTKIAGNRVYNGATQSWSGAQTGDTLPAFQSGDWLVGQFLSGPTMSANVSGESAGPELVWEIKTDQGIS